MSNKISPIVFSFIVSIGISFIFTLITFWIFYKYSGNYSAAKDAFSTTGSYFGAITTLVASIIAAYIFNGWKAQHNKEIEIQFILKVIQVHQDFDLKITRMFQFEYTNIDLALANEQFIRECSTLELDVRLIQCRYEDYCSFIKVEMPQHHKDIFLKLRRTINIVRKTDDLAVKRKILKHRIYDDLLEFSNDYEGNIHSFLIGNLKALN